MRKKHPYRDYDKNPQQTLLKFKKLKSNKNEEKPAEDVVVETKEEIDNWMEI